MQYLKDQGCKYVRSYAWVRPDGSCPSCSILEKNGFEVVKDVGCPFCDKGCQCIARVYQKEL